MKCMKISGRERFWPGSKNRVFRTGLGVFLAAAAAERKKERPSMKSSKKKKVMTFWILNRREKRAKAATVSISLLSWDRGMLMLMMMMSNICPGAEFLFIREQEGEKVAHSALCGAKAKALKKSSRLVLRMSDYGRVWLCVCVFCRQRRLNPTHIVVIIMCGWKKGDACDRYGLLVPFHSFHAFIIQCTYSIIYT